MPLTESKLRAIRPNGSRFELPDRDGLSLRVSQRGVMTWTITYRVQGAGEVGGERRERLSGDKRRFTVGEYPQVSLAEARGRRLTFGVSRVPGTTPSKFCALSLSPSCA